MVPWMWLAAGTALLAIELLLIDAQFYLVFMGLAAIIVGLVALVGVELPVWGEWSTFGLLSLVFLFGFRRRLYGQLRGKLPTMTSGPAGAYVVLPEDLPAGGTCRLEHQGTVWTAQNAGTSPLARGSRVRIGRVDGLTLIVGVTD